MLASEWRMEGESLGNRAATRSTLNVLGCMHLSTKLGQFTCQREMASIIQFRHLLCHGSSTSQQHNSFPPFQVCWRTHKHETFPFLYFKPKRQSFDVETDHHHKGQQCSSLKILRSGSRGEEQDQPIKSSTPPKRLLTSCFFFKQAIEFMKNSRIECEFFQQHKTWHLSLIVDWLETITPWSTLMDTRTYVPLVSLTPETIVQLVCLHSRSAICRRWDECMRVDILLLGWSAPSWPHRHGIGALPHHEPHHMTLKANDRR